MPKFMLASEAARVLGISPDMVVLHEKNGKLPCQKTVGGVRLFDSRDVEEFLAKRQAAKKKKAQK
jgi:excisionase family DNA binding protein